TDEEARRYCMTTAEAVLLVLQASTMGRGGEIFVLNMGEPIKVVDLARRMILLSGRDPDKDIKIVFTGLRSGEKLNEELRLEAEGIKQTPHDKMWVLEGGTRNFLQVRNWLDELSRLVETRNVHGVISKLIEIVPEYEPSQEIINQAEIDRHDQVQIYKRSWTDLSANE